MRIRKTSQYIEGGATLSNTVGSSTTNGYSQEYINNNIPHMLDQYDSSLFNGYSCDYINDNVVVTNPLKVLGPVNTSAIAGNSSLDVDVSNLINQIPYNSLCLFVINASNHSNYSAIIVAYVGVGYIHTFVHTIYSNYITVSRVNGTTIKIQNTSSGSTNSSMKVQLIKLSY